mmetsp:Transcript_88842/g.167416  ORF Transcript_88842/g.167416 Transcript_88842/m.167416 type:complete len:163 (-) Transcript_88842:93-581(-)
MPAWNYGTPPGSARRADALPPRPATHASHAGRQVASANFADMPQRAQRLDATASHFQTVLSQWVPRRQDDLRLRSLSRPRRQPKEETEPSPGIRRPIDEMRLRSLATPKIRISENEQAVLVLRGSSGCSPRKVTKWERVLGDRFTAAPEQTAAVAEDSTSCS